MNSFETDMKRAIFSIGFFMAIIAQLIVLFAFSSSSTFYTMSVPIVCTFAYSSSFLDEYKNGFIRFSLSRAGFSSYINSKFLSGIISGGLSEVISLKMFYLFKEPQNAEPKYLLLFLSVCFWTSVSLLLSSISKSKYITYGGAFIIFYFLLILCERNFKNLYCLNPTEWYNPQNVWIFDDTGIIIMLLSLILIIYLFYYLVVRRLLENV